MADERPLCQCHGEPMYWFKNPRYRAGGYWVCAVKRRQRNLAYYHNLTGFEYNRVLLQKRRVKALRRMKERNQRQEEQGG